MFSQGDRAMMSVIEIRDLLYKFNFTQMWDELQRKGLEDKGRKIRESLAHIVKTQRRGRQPRAYREIPEIKHIQPPKEDHKGGGLRKAVASV